ncbi:MAG: transcription-repair coupling factor [Aggregatilineales bacterium]
MLLSGLLDVLRASEAYRVALDQLKGAGSISDLRAIRAARPATAAALAADWPGPVVYIVARVDHAYNVAEQLPVWLGERPILRFAEPAPLFYDRAPWGETVIRSRIGTLAALLPPDDFAQVGPPPVIVTSARALMQRTLPAHAFRQATLVLRPGQRYALDRLLAHWLRLGYEAAPVVTAPGAFSRRGGIVDIFPVAADAPVRIEFFNDEIESLRAFDPATQRSTVRLPLAVVTPAREALPQHTPPLAAHLRPWLESLPPNANATSPRSDLEPLANGVPFAYLEHYIPYLYPNPVSLLDYAPDNALFLVDDWAELREAVAAVEAHALANRAERLAAGLLAPDHPLPYITWDDLRDELVESRRALNLGGVLACDNDAQDAPSLRSLFAPEQRFGGQLKLLLDHLRQLRRSGGRAVVVTAQAERLADLWRQQGGYAPLADDVTAAPEPGTLLFVNGMLREGWRLHADSGDLHLFTDHEIFGWTRPEPRRRKTGPRPRAPETSYADLRDGDYVVHVDYGIGRFAGLTRRTFGGSEREYLLVEYAGTDLLFVPIHQADRLTRYIGPDDRPPTLNRLGRPDWIKIKSQAKKAVEDEARELLDLYARRAQQTGHAFSPDTHWQHELEASFPYVETEDQLRAVREVKADMELPRPMDRLICGDVGFGKTEVALRAAFKAVMDGKQVAVLVPTTVLAQQHYDNFSRRLASFPVKVEMLSRFRSKEEQARLLARLASGDVDIVIGTHRLLSDDVKLKDLGLVIIDEEQRFGVTHKEHFKRLRTQVDVLTLTATPIPRTLYMSLTGVRDISMIETPPEDRLPVITHVGPFDERLVRQAVLRELDCGGQVFFVHNRVQSVEAARERLEAIVPELRTVIGHGQMDARTLERVMVAFSRGEYDALVCTSIVENGIDIPNANTLIVDRADWFGMAQLYQLRGRVGRGAQQAYAYFFHPGEDRLTPEARQRLETLAENTALGSGFQIAMRDLELRGAGDILSTRQTGHVAAIGLHLYTQLLADAVRALKGEAAVQPAPVNTAGVAIDLPLPAYLPTAWIPEMELRLQIYRRMGGLTARADVEALRDELRDRFGPLPPAVENLLYQIHIKLLAQAASATAVTVSDDAVLVKLPYLAEVDRQALAARLGPDIAVTRVAVQVPLNGGGWQARLLRVLEQLADGVRAAAGV